MKRFLSPSELWNATKKWYQASTIGQQNKLLSKLHNFHLAKDSNPVEALLEIEDIAAELSLSGAAVDHQHVYILFVSALTAEYNLEVRELSRKESFDLVEILTLVRSGYELVKRQKKSSPRGHALIGDDGRGNGRARGRGKGRGVARDGGRSWNRGGKSNSSSKKSEDGGKAAMDSSDGKTSDKLKGPKCFTRRRRGHISAECTVEKCKRCGGVGHSKNQCPSPQELEESVLAVDLDEMVKLPDVGQYFLEAESLLATCTEGDCDEVSFVIQEMVDHGPETRTPSSRALGPQGKSDDSRGRISGVGGVALQAGGVSASWISDSGSSSHVTPNASQLQNFRSCNRFLRVTNRKLLPIEGFGDLALDFRSGQDVVRVRLRNVAYVPFLSYHLLSLPSLAKEGHTYFGNCKGIRLNLKYGKKVLAPFLGKLCLQFAVRVESDVDNACATIAPGLMPTIDTDINTYHWSTGHTHHRLLMHSTKQQGVSFKTDVKLQPCTGCSAAKGIRAPVKEHIDRRSDERLGRGFVDLPDKKPVKSHRGYQYAMIFRDDMSRITWLYFLRSKDEAPDALEQCLADVREDGIPKFIHSDDANSSA